MKGESLVYFVRVDDAPFVKIGHTTDLAHRLFTIQTDHWRPVWLALVMPGGPELERELHGRFADDRHLGEWFSLTDSIERFIRACAPEYEELRGRYAWHGPMSQVVFASIHAKLNPDGPPLTDAELAMLR